MTTKAWLLLSYIVLTAAVFNLRRSIIYLCWPVRLSHQGHINAVVLQDCLIIDLLEQAFLYHVHVLLQITFDFNVLKVKATRPRSAATSRTRRETTLAYHAAGPHFHSFSRCLDRLLTQLVVPLDSTNRQLAPVHVLELITTFDALFVSFFDVLCVPLLPNLLVCRHVLHHLVVH